MFLGARHRELARRAGEVAASIRTEDPRRVVEILGASGLLRHVAPRRITARGLCVIRRALAYHSSLVDTMFAMQGLGSHPITLAGTEEQKRRYVEGAASGRKIAAFAVTEPEAGSDVQAIGCRARKVRGRYVLDGVKTFISNAGIADFYTLFARTGRDGITAFVVDAGTEGLSLAREIRLIAPHPIGEIRLEGCRVAASARLGGEGEGLRVAFGTLEMFRPSVGAAAVGMAERALTEAIAHTRGRRQFGSAIADFQGTRMRLAEMRVELDAAALLVERAAYVRDVEKRRTALESAAAKLFATEAAQRIIDAAVQLHGGLGVVRGVVVERLYREIRALRIYEGTSEIQKLVIAREMLGGRGGSGGRG